MLYKLYIPHYELRKMCKSVCPVYLSDVVGKRYILCKSEVLDSILTTKTCFSSVVVLLWPKEL